MRQTEEKFKQFLQEYPTYQTDENARMVAKEEKISENLAEIARIIQVTQTLPENAANFGKLRSNLEFKERELQQNEGTVDNLQVDNVKLQKQLTKIEAMENKLKTELNLLNMESEDNTEKLREYKDIKGLQDRESEKGDLLGKLLKHSPDFMGVVVAK